MTPDGIVIRLLDAHEAPRIVDAIVGVYGDSDDISWIHDHAGQTVSLPAARGHHRFTRVERHLAHWAVARGILGNCSEATAAHPDVAGDPAGS